MAYVYCMAFYSFSFFLYTHAHTQKPLDNLTPGKVKTPDDYHVRLSTTSSKCGNNKLPGMEMEMDMELAREMMMKSCCNCSVASTFFCVYMDKTKKLKH